MSHIFCRLFAGLLLTVVIGGVTGCASPAVDAIDPVEKPVADGSGIVIVSVSSNFQKAPFYNEGWIKPLTEDGKLDANKPGYVLRRSHGRFSRDTVMMVGAVPAGKYVFSGLVEQRFNEGATAVSLTESIKRLGTFEVFPGKVSDLGRLVVTPDGDNAMAGRSARQTSNVPLIRRAIPQYMQFINAGVVEGWTTPHQVDDQVEDNAIQHPAGFGYPVALADGRVAVPSRVGTVLVRDQAGHWTSMHHQGNESIMRLLPVNLPDSSLIGVGEYNTLIRLPLGGEEFVAVDTGDLPPGNLLYINGNSKVGWYVASQDGDNVSILHSDRLGAGHWTIERQEKVEFSSEYSTMQGLANFWVWGDASGFCYALGSGALNCISFATLAWDKRSSIGDGGIYDLRVNADGSIGVTSTSALKLNLTTDLGLSKDNGLTWKTINSPFSRKVTAPVVEKNGTMYLHMGGWNTILLDASTDGGETWTTVNEYGNVQRQFYPSPAGGLFAVERDKLPPFYILYSGDGGHTWALEYTSFNAKKLEK